MFDCHGGGPIARGAILKDMSVWGSGMANIPIGLTAQQTNQEAAKFIVLLVRIGSFGTHGR